LPRLRFSTLGDLECPFCRDFTLEVLPSIIQRWVRGGDLRIEYHALETATRGSPSVRGPACCGRSRPASRTRPGTSSRPSTREQGEEGSGYVTDTFVEGIRRRVPDLNLSQWSSDRADPELANEIAADEQAAISAGLNGTPSFPDRQERGRDDRVSPPTDLASFDAAIERLRDTLP